MSNLRPATGCEARSPEVLGTLAAYYLRNAERVRQPDVPPLYPSLSPAEMGAQRDTGGVPRAPRPIARRE
jgi:hypothetical protein